MCPANESGAITDSNPLIRTGIEEKQECDNVSSNQPHFHGILHRLPLSELAEDLRSLGKIVCPVTTMTLLLHSKSVISMLFLGHLGDAPLAGGALAISFANITGFSVIKGMSMGMEPICCQAFGAKKMSVISQTFQRTLCLLLLTAIFISFLWLNMEPILLFLGQDRDIIDVAKLYLRFSIPELIAQVHLHPLRSFLRTQCITKPLTIATSICLFFHLPINYFFVIYLKLGVKGVALGSACNTINLDISILIYLLCSNMELKPWHGLTIFSPFQGWKMVLNLALPSVLSVCLEWWWYEIMLFLCGLLQNPKASVAAMGILIQTTGLLYVFPHALSMGLSTRIGHELGASQPNKAQRLAVLGLVSGLTMGVTAFGLTIVVRSVWGKMYTSEPEILSLISVALPVLGFCEIGNCPQTAACGVLTGSARTKIGAKINFVAFYLVGLPVAVAMAFWVKVGFIGLWFGLAAAQAACMCMMIYTLITTDWRHQAKRSEELTQVAEETEDLETGLLS
ncbi:protein DETOXIFICATION 53 [Spinacia oleracea]|uniref:Protein DETOXIFICATION n=1 Tax=Spinacia oleracea TaxID=3562 RepID=A0A9R0J4K3_SPIOL|nr:protein DETOXIFICATION 53 [Spinacia oleracea]